MGWTESGELGNAVADSPIEGREARKPGGCTCEAKLAAAFIAGYRLGKGSK